MALTRVNFENVSLSAIATTCRALLRLPKTDSFSTHHSVVLVAIANRICAWEDSESSAEPMVETAFTLAGAFPDETQQRLRALLEVFEAAPMLSFPPRGRFSSLAPSEQDKMIDRWASGPPHLRAAFHSLKGLIMLSHYGGPAGWPGLGYSLVGNPGLEGRFGS